MFLADTAATSAARCIMHNATAASIFALRLRLRQREPGLEDPPGLSPITTIGRFASVEEAQVATDEVWAVRRRS
jgi:hypothetical protein